MGVGSGSTVQGNFLQANLARLEGRGKAVVVITHDRPLFFRSRRCHQGWNYGSWCRQNAPCPVAFEPVLKTESNGHCPGQFKSIDD